MLAAGRLVAGGALGPRRCSPSAIPTNRGTQITVALSAPGDVSATILNIAGRPVRRLCTERPCEAGTDALLWDAVSDYGLRVPDGVYLVEVRARGGDGGQNRVLGQVRLNR